MSGNMKGVLVVIVSLYYLCTLGRSFIFHILCEQLLGPHG